MIEKVEVEKAAPGAVAVQVVRVAEARGRAADPAAVEAVAVGEAGEAAEVEANNRYSTAARQYFCPYYS